MGLPSGPGSGSDPAGVTVPPIAPRSGVEGTYGSRRPCFAGACGAADDAQRGLCDHGPVDLIRRPELLPPFDGAFDAAIEFLDGLPETIIGLWMAGSLARNEGDANSDLDFYVLIEDPHRRRIQRLFNGVPAEMFLNPPHRARAYFEEDRALGRTPGLAMMAEGLILYDPRGECVAISDEARAAMERGPAVDAVALETRRYLVADKLDNAADVVDRDPATARLLASAGVHEATVLWFLRAGEWAPRDKDLLPAIRARVPAVASLLDEFAAGGDVAVARAAVELLIGVAGFYEWETPPESAPPGHAPLS